MVAAGGSVLTLAKETARSVRESLAAHVLSPEILHYSNDITFAGLGVVALSSIYAVSGIHRSIQERESYRMGWIDSAANIAAVGSVATEATRAE